MRYTKDDYNHAIAILTGRGTSAANLAPSERRVLDQVRAGYVLHADVPLSEVKLARALFTACGIATTTPELAQG